MPTWKLLVKQFFQNKLLFSLWAVFHAFTAVYFVFRTIRLAGADAEPLSYLCISLELAVLVFIFFLFLAFIDCARLQKVRLHECMCATGKGTQAVLMTQVVILLLLALGYTAALFLLNAAVYLILFPFKGAYLLHIAGTLLLYLCMPGLIAVLLGAFAAQLQKKWAAYLVMLLFLAASTEIFAGVSDIVYNSMGVSLYPLYHVFRIFPIGLDWMPIANYGYETLPQRYFMALFWALLFAGGLVWSIRPQHKKRLFACILCFCMSISFLIAGQLPASRVLPGHDPEKGFSADAIYYMDADQRNQPADFHVTEYQLDMRVDRMLFMTASMRPDKTDLPQYLFTLYHGYQVSSVTDGSGDPLAFQQDGDYLEVRNPDGRSLERIIMCYSGSAPKFYSNRQGVFLPGFFAFYPRSGYHMMFDNYLQGFHRITSVQESLFDIRVQTHKNVYCNLERSGENSFRGSSNALTLMSGFLQSMKVGDLTVVYPFLATGEFNPGNIESIVSKYAESPVIPSRVKTIFIMPNTNLVTAYERFAQYSDHMAILQLLGMEEMYEMQKTDANKVKLVQIFEMYQYDRPMFQHIVETTDDRDFRLFHKATQKIGEAEIRKGVNWFLSDDSDTRTIQEFLESLMGGN
jgi:hypothetical protein